MARRTVLIVDDEPDILSLLELTLERMGLDTVSAGNLADARAALGQRAVDLCLTDMKLPDGSGIDLVREIQQRDDEIPVAVITAYGSVEAAVESLKAGAFDFVSKPVDVDALRRLVGAALKGVEEGPRERRSRNTLLGESPSMRRLRGLIAKVSRGQAPVYISGESGTGKELVARLIHDKSPRSDGPFVPVNCGAIPAELVESELFGHKKGSFTGATADKQGLFQAAEGGTLFLDEVAELPPATQVKLLRAIQERAVRPVGAEREVAVDARLVSATNNPLGELVERGDFRRDLYYRLNVIDLHVPPLRERREDLPLLVERILDRLAEGGSESTRLDDQALAALQRYSFPGNVRELENILERAVTLCEDGVIRPDDLQLPEEPATANGADRAAGEVEGVEEAVTPAGGAAAASLDDRLGSIERDTIQRALEANRYNKTATARELGMTFRQLRYRLKKLGID